MHKAVEDTAKAGEGDSDPIANVAAGGVGGNAAATNAGTKANKDSVTGIAKGMKAIVDAAGKAGVEFKPAGVEGADVDNGDAGKLFASGDAAANGAGANADDEAAAFVAVGMQNKNDQIAAAIVLRGLAKNGKFANTSADDGDAANAGADANAGEAGKAAADAGKALLVQLVGIRY
ncbi:variable large family protein (plasmid) [Borreliella andersonii]|uniref:Variable large family protein n=1 Tax=Borrelia andersonii TaxID=42109 RepID=A0ACD5G7D8_BORAD